MTARKLQALRNLAERPGTAAEGALAREILARVEAKQPVGDDIWEIFKRRGQVVNDEFLETLRRDIARRRAEPLPTHWTCPCGSVWPAGVKCENYPAHFQIQGEIQRRFKPGERVFYNYWAYSLNDPATVKSYIHPKPYVYTHPWAWINLKFDHLKSPRQVPIYSVKGWHLTHEPLSQADAERMAGI